MAELSDFRNAPWSDIIDPARALSNVEADIFGDWYRDPWGWPELRWLKDQERFGPLFAHAAAGTPARLVPVDVPKPGFGSRPAVVMAPLDRLLYQAVVDRMSKQLIGNLTISAFGWRLPPTEPKPGVYSRNNLQWENYMAALTRSAQQHDFLLETDVVSCFASIDCDALVDKVRAAYSGVLPARLLSILDAWKGLPGRRGLPQRCQASSVLANFFLQPLDDVVTAFTSAQSPVAGFRWMDDISVFGARESQLRILQVELGSRMRGLGIEMNQAKTRILEGDHMRATVQELDLKAMDYGLRQGMGARAIDPLLMEVLGQPTGTPRTRIRFLCRRLRDNHYFDKVGSLAEVAHLLPHAADDLGRLFSDAGLWHDLEGWYVDYIKGEWSLFDWAVVGLGTMFPTSSIPTAGVVDGVVELLDSRKRGLLVAAFVSQRLAAWSSEAARYHLMKAAESAQNALERRCFCYGALSAGAEKSKVRALLGDFADSHLYLAYLEQNDMRAPRVTKDYSGDDDPF